MLSIYILSRSSPCPSIVQCYVNMVHKVTLLERYLVYRGNEYGPVLVRCHNITVSRETNTNDELFLERIEQVPT